VGTVYYRLGLRLFSTHKYPKGFFTILFSFTIHTVRMEAHTKIQLTIPCCAEEIPCSTIYQQGSDMELLETCMKLS
jgi:hypothetical protein